jgi:hypothetical protein
LPAFLAEVPGLSELLPTRDPAFRVLFERAPTDISFISFQ